MEILNLYKNKNKNFTAVPLGYFEPSLGRILTNDKMKADPELQAVNY